MELAKLASDEIKSYDQARLREVENDLRRELAMLRMDIYGAKGKQAATVRGLKKTLARVLTQRSALAVSGKHTK